MLKIKAGASTTIASEYAKSIMRTVYSEAIKNISSASIARKLSFALLISAATVTIYGCDGSEVNASNTENDNSEEQIPEPPTTGNAETDSESTDSDEESDVLTRMLGAGDVVYGQDMALQLGALSTVAIYHPNALCENGGSLGKEHSDNDSNNEISPNDEYLISFGDCKLSVFSELLNGDISIKVLEYADDASITKFELSTSELNVGTSPVDAVITARRNRTPIKTNLTVSSEEPIKLQIDSGDIAEYAFSKLTRTENHRTALWTVDGAGEIRISNTGHTLEFNATTPWQGYLHEYPHEGEMELERSDNTIQTISSNYVQNSNSFNVVSDQASSADSWLNYIDGYLWSYDSRLPDYSPRMFKLDNFNFLGIRSDVDLKRLPDDGEIIFQASRPIASIKSDDVKFTNYDWPYTYIETRLTLDGALLKVKPKGNLHGGKSYSLDSISVTGEYGQKANMSIYATIDVDDSLIAHIDTSSLAFRENDTPTLDGSKSVINEGSDISYQWVDTKNIGIEFSTPNAVSTSFTVPSGTNRDVNIQLKITNEYGKQSIKQITLNHIRPQDSFIAMSLSGGDTNKQTNHLHTSRDGSFTSHSTANNPNQVWMEYSGDSWFELYLQARNKQPLEMGLYTGVSTYDYIDENKLSMFFYTTGTYCEDPSGSFELFELDYDSSGVLDSLAVDFLVTCNNDDTQINGTLRFNSTATINP